MFNETELFNEINGSLKEIKSACKNIKLHTFEKKVRVIEKFKRNSELSKTLKLKYSQSKKTN